MTRRCWLTRTTDAGRKTQVRRSPMGVTQLFAAGRRLMFKEEVDWADHDKTGTIASDVITYETPQGSTLSVVWIRVWCKKPWKYRLIAVDLDTARELSSAVFETW